MKWIAATEVLLLVWAWVAFDWAKKPRPADDWLPSVIAGALCTAAGAWTAFYVVAVVWNHAFW